MEPFRRALQHRADTYVSSSFVSEMSTASVFLKDDKITLVLGGEKSNLKSFWSGKWQSQWMIVFSGNTAEFSGEVKLHVHYFEDGNLQMQSTKLYPSISLNLESPEGLATEVISRIMVICIMFFF